MEPTRRSEEVQAILKLEEIGDTRAALNTAQNRLTSVKRNAAAHVQSSRNNLLVHTQIATLKADDLLGAVNKRRTLLNLPPLDQLTPDTKLDSGLTASGVIRFFLSLNEHKISEKPENRDHYYFYLVYYQDGVPIRVEEWLAAELYESCKFGPNGFVIALSRD